MTQYVTIISKLRNILKERFDAGGISKTDLIQVEVQLRDAENQKIDIYKQYLVALQNINILMGVAPTSSIVLKDSITSTMAMPTLFELEEVLNNRAEYKISNLNLEYQKHQRKVEMSDYNPEVSLALIANVGTAAFNLTGESVVNAIAMAKVSIPVFHWGARYKKGSSQDALVASKEFDLQKTQDNISKEASSAWSNYNQTSKQLQIVDETCLLAEENLDLNTFSYTEGKLPIVDVLTAQLKWIQAKTSRISTYYQHKVLLADYNKAIGNR